MASRPPSAAARGSLRSPGRAPARPAACALDPVIHERTRLAIVSTLAANDRVRFRDLKALLGLSDGNLSVHARRLEEAGYVAVTKSFEGRTPKTEFRLTAAGRDALERYLRSMEALIRAVPRA